MRLIIILLALPFLSFSQINIDLSDSDSEILKQISQIDKVGQSIYINGPADPIEFDDLLRKYDPVIQDQVSKIEETNLTLTSVSQEIYECLESGTAEDIKARNFTKNEYRQFAKENRFELKEGRESFMIQQLQQWYKSQL